MCSPRRVKNTKQKGVLLWMLEAERQRKERELKSLELLARLTVGLIIVIAVVMVAAFMYTVIM